MKISQKFLIPIYGLRNSLEKDLVLGEGLFLRNINLLNNEVDFFKKYNLEGHYNVVLEVDYEYDDKSPSEPLPGISIGLLNMFDASLVVYGEGKVGIAGIFPYSNDGSFPGGEILFYGKVSYQDCLDKIIDESFAEYYKKFTLAYNLRPVAFDLFRRSQERYSNNDKTIDNCTVLESIFVPKGERSKSPFIINGLKIMGFDVNQVKSISDLVEYRNSIIHADREKQLKLLSGRKYTYFWFEETFKLVREILYRFVNNPWI